MESGPPRNEVRGPYFSLTFPLISPHPLICERGELYHLNKRKKLLHICQHVELFIPLMLINMSDPSPHLGPQHPPSLPDRPLLSTRPHFATHS